MVGSFYPKNSMCVGPITSFVQFGELSIFIFLLLFIILFQTIQKKERKGH